MTSGTSPAIRRLCLAVDVQRYSALDNAGQLRAQAVLKRLLDQALDAAGLRRSRVERQDRGDGQLVLLPAAIDEGAAIGAVVRRLTDGLAEANRAGGDRLRLRLALAQGVTHRAATGFVGKAVVDACRLVNASELRAALESDAGRDLVVAVTDDLFQDVVVHGYAGLSGAGFRRVHIDLLEKAYSSSAWLSLPDAGPPAPSARPRRRRVRLLAAAAALVAVVGAGLVFLNRTPVTPPESPFAFADHGPVGSCEIITGTGLVPEGFELRLYARGGDLYYVTALAAEADRDRRTWTMRQVAFGDGRAGEQVTVYAALLTEAESARITRDYETTWASPQLPERVVAIHVFTRSGVRNTC
ncbi:hypothetical protein GCM10010399_85840 [Dactylosporangium fulvum]|uniref:Uncharacterized protein n=1 Tax=Dactylosporangium fulvum TaxID=53359 RepID=A0ABY5WCA6_9ACTN|nr:hypothetical protein [Dactylosporangium fulvum]UWP87005.1 hypothetical protein Dfulv_23290 [Dactylosporangium fulvum]